MRVLSWPGPSMFTSPFAPRCNEKHSANRTSAVFDTEYAVVCSLGRSAPPPEVITIFGRFDFMRSGKACRTLRIGP